MGKWVHSFFEGCDATVESQCSIQKGAWTGRFHAALMLHHHKPHLKERKTRTDLGGILLSFSVIKYLLRNTESKCL